MYGGDVYNQNASAAGVTYNCGGEIPTLFPRVRPPSFTRVLANSPTDLVPSSCHANRLRVGGRASSRGHRHLSRVRLPHPVQETHEAEYVHGIPDSSGFPFEPRRPALASVSGATASRTESDRPFTDFPSAVVQFEAR